jgi:RNase P/RNase MRP subunit p29
MLALSVAALDVAAAPARPGRVIGELRPVFLEADDRAPVRRAGHDGATIDVGRVIAGRSSSRLAMRTVVRRQFRMRVDGSASVARFARVRAFVQNDTPGHRVRIDGRLLTSAPQLLDAAVPLGVPVSHVLEIEVPISEHDGALTETIVWQVEDVR